MAEKTAPPKGKKKGGLLSGKIFGLPAPAVILGGGVVAYLLYKKLKGSSAATTASTSTTPASTGTDTSGTGTDTGTGSGVSGSGGGYGGGGGYQGGGLSATLAAIQAEIGALVPGGSTTNNYYSSTNGTAPNSPVSTTPVPVSQKPTASPPNVNAGNPPGTRAPTQVNTPKPAPAKAFTTPTQSTKKPPTVVGKKGTGVQGSGLKNSGL